MIVNQIYPVEEKQHVSVNLDHKITVEYDQPIMARVFRVILKNSIYYLTFFFETNILTE